MGFLGVPAVFAALAAQVAQGFLEQEYIGESGSKRYEQRGDVRGHTPRPALGEVAEGTVIALRVKEHSHKQANVSKSDDCPKRVDKDVVDAGSFAVCRIAAQCGY